jgi:molybdopterin/thiamine biosynthesis adenylyltransferase
VSGGRCRRGNLFRMSALEQLDRTILLARDYVCPALSDNEIRQTFQLLRIRCVADRRNLSSHAGQTCLVTLVALLSRLGLQVTLSIPSISVLRRQPPFRGSCLLESLLASSNQLITGATVEQHRAGDHSDMIFVLGDSPLENGASPTWRLTGGDWDGAVRPEPRRAGHAWSTGWPIGAMVSATLAAGEVFKCAMRRMALRNPEDCIFFFPSEACAWNFGAIPVPEAGLDLGTVDIISAGAITQAALFALLRVPNLTLNGRVFDEDATAATNANRNMLTLLSDVGKNKVQLVAQRCHPDFRLTPILQRFGTRTAETFQIASCVLLGVDDIPSRWEVQRRTRGVLLVSGTSHFSVSSSTHAPSEPCCGCLHPVDDVGGPITIPTVSFVSFWAGLAMAVRLLRHALGAPYLRDRQHLWLTPLRMDEPYAAVWSPVATRIDCPVRCPSSRTEG